jgi:ATP-dependent DNA helicase DinG
VVIGIGGVSNSGKSYLAENLVGLLHGNVFVAHDIRFDLPFLRWEFARRGIGRPAVTGLCTLQLSRQFWPDLGSRSLPDLAKHFGIDHGNPHRAGADAAATAGVLLEALRESDQIGLVDLGDLYRVEEISAALEKDGDSLESRAAES